MIFLLINGEKKLFKDCIELNKYLKIYNEQINNEIMGSKTYSPVGVSNEMYSLIKKETNWKYVSGRILRGENTGYSIVVNKINGFYYLNMFEYSKNTRELVSSAIDPKFSVMRKSYSGIKQLFKSLTSLELLDDKAEKDVFLDKFREIHNSGYDYEVKKIGNDSALALILDPSGGVNPIRVSSIVDNSNNKLCEIEAYINDYIKRNK